MSNPGLGGEERSALVRELMKARRAVRDAKGNPQALKATRGEVDVAKRTLGERGPPWWTDGAPDYNRCLVKNTPYAAWFNSLGMLHDDV